VPAALAGVLACALLLALLPVGTRGQGENLLNRISNERMAAYEARLTAEINTALSRYVSRHQYVLAVKVIWNPDIVPVIENPQMTPQQQKLPGFPIFVRAPDSPALEGGTPPFTRLEVKVLIDETLPEYYERFVRKIVPIVARLDFNRGDQVVVLKETFPVLPKEEEPPPTLSEKELMEQLGQQPAPGAMPPPPGAGMQIVPQLALPFGGAAPSPYTAQTATSPAEAAQLAFDEGRLRDALRIVQSAFQRSTTNRERGFYLGMEGSLHYRMNNSEAAKAAWQRAVTYDPSNLEVHEVLNFLESPPQGESP
jgi:hypothetical protein